MTPRASTLEILDRLIGFNTVSAKSNLDLIRFVQDYLTRHGVASELVPNAEKTKANLYATIGPDVAGGIVLSGHTDVVPVEGQDWTSDPFTLTTRDGRLYGRGTADMKGFIAAVLAAVPDFVAGSLTRPIHLAFSYDEEVGCTGVRPMLDVIARKKPLPAIAIIGEPTSMRVVNAHKGLRHFRTRITGLEAHSSRTHEGVNAVVAASRFILFLESLQTEFRERSEPSCRFTPPYTTISVGRIGGGTAFNIIPNDCSFEWEYRPLPGSDEEEVLRRLDTFVKDTLLPEMRARMPQAAIDTEMLSDTPGLGLKDGSSAEELALRLAQQNSVHTVAYTTEAGLFERTGIPSVVCGPGDIAQAHKPDEFTDPGQLAQCEAFLARLRDVVAA